MDNWVLKATKNLVNEATSEQKISPTQVKVKVSHLLLTDYDALLYSGNVQAAYPKTLGRTAVGIITEVGEQCYGLEKNMRVFLRPIRSCGVCHACKTGKSKDCVNTLTAGADFDGFMRDFVVCNYNEVAPLPPTVDDYHALCIETVGIADYICDKLNLTTGQKVAVIGGDFTGNIIAQTLQYRKIIPIVIDNYPDNLKKASACGVAYAFPNDESLVDNVKSATAGRMCDAAIYCSSSRLPVSIASRIITKGTAIAVVGISYNVGSIDTRELVENDLTFFGVSHTYGYSDAVINMLNHNAINLDPFIKRVITDYNPIELLEERCADFFIPRKPRMTILKMIF